MATADPLPLPIHTLSACNSSSSISNSIIHVLLHLILPSYNWPSSPPRTCLAYIYYFLYKLFTLSFSPYGQTLTYFFSPIRLHHTNLPSCHTAHSSQITHFHTMYSSLLCPIQCLVNSYIINPTHHPSYLCLGSALLWTHEYTRNHHVLLSVTEIIHSLSSFISIGYIT